MKRALPLAAAALLALGCLSPPPDADGFVDPDPYETQNRLFFAFNDGLDRIALEPIGRLWRFITPQILRTALDNAFLTLRYPERAVSCLGQARLNCAGTETLRFAVNSTLGVAGLWDASTRLFELPFYDEDTGQMFAAWGVPAGPFWMIPLLGPSNPRDTVGYILDGFLNLTPSYAAPVAWVNGRAIAVPTVDRAREASLDYYLFVRDSYIQRREMQVDERGPTQRLRGAEPEGGEGPAEDFYELEEFETEAGERPGE
jgi:phospholipid-binding lipoprotein MlaA